MASTTRSERAVVRNQYSQGRKVSCASNAHERRSRSPSWTEGHHSMATLKHLQAETGAELEVPLPARLARVFKGDL